MPLYKRINYILTVVPVLLFSLGYVTQLSTSNVRATNHFIFFLLAYALFWAMSMFEYRLFYAIYKPFYVTVLCLLVIVFVFGASVLGSVRWISIGILNFQPSELAKLAMILFVSFYIVSNPKSITDFKQLLKLLIYVFPAILFVLLQPDLGSSIILTLAVTGILFVAGLHWIYFFTAICIFGIFSTPMWHLLKDYQQHRILVFLNPSLDTLGKGYNVIQSLISIGSGGLWGKGFGHGSQSHLNFLPIYWTDFVFASFSEEWGFIGVLVLTSLFIILLLSILHTLVKSSDQLGSILCGGVFTVIFGQFVINVGMNMGLLPVTGIPLPFVSQGGTSMITTALMLGLVHSVWLHRHPD